MRELPTSIQPRPVWRDEVRIDMGGADESSAGGDTADEPLGQSDDELLLARHDRDWEVRMLARELDRREHRASLSDRAAASKGGSKTPPPLPAAPFRGPLHSVRSLEERRGEIGASSSSSPPPPPPPPPTSVSLSPQPQQQHQRSASSDDIYRPTSDSRAPPPVPVDRRVSTPASVSPTASAPSSDLGLPRPPGAASS